jgi:hypothetical protein
MLLYRLASIEAKGGNLAGKSPAGPHSEGTGPAGGARTELAGYFFFLASL